MLFRYKTFNISKNYALDISDKYPDWANTLGQK